MSASELASEKEAPGLPPWVWVLVVIGIGVAAGLIMAFVVEPLTSFPSQGHVACGSSSSPCPYPDQNRGLGAVSLVLSAVSFSLLIALLVHYTRMYRRTKARVMLALTIFLLAMVMEAIFASPFPFLGFGMVSSGFIFSLIFGRLFMVVALTIFLYISLE